MITGGVGLAVPIKSVCHLLKGGHQQARLGVLARPVRITMKRRQQRIGLMIVRIAKNSAPEMASLMLGDILIGVEGTALDSIEDIERELEGEAECLVRLHFLRGDRTTTNTVAVRLGPRSAAA